MFCPLLGFGRKIELVIQPQRHTDLAFCKRVFFQWLRQKTLHSELKLVKTILNRCGRFNEKIARADCWIVISRHFTQFFHHQRFWINGGIVLDTRQFYGRDKINVLGRMDKIQIQIRFHTFISQILVGVLFEQPAIDSYHHGRGVRTHRKARLNAFSMVEFLKINCSNLIGFKAFWFNVF